MRRLSDLIVLSIQVILGYLLVHYASPWSSNLILIALSLCLFFIGALIGVKALIDLGKSFAVAPSPTKNSDLVSKGIYSQIRHPMYLSVLLAATSILIVGFNNKTTMVYLIGFLFFVVKIHFEELSLVAKFPEYRQYQNETRRIFPRRRSSKQ